MTYTSISAKPVDTDVDQRHWAGIFIVGTIAVVVATGVLVMISIARNDNHLVYALDDAAIHMSIVKNLVEHGTWGVVPHEYVSASSSPGWELLLVGPVLVVPSALNVFPLLVNVLSAVGIVWLLAREQRFLRLDRWGWLSSILLVELVILVMLLPTLALVGMEHTTQAFTALLALVLFQRTAAGTGGRHQEAALIGALFLAGLFRLEAVFLAVGIAAGLLAMTVPRISSATRGAPLDVGRAIALGAAGIGAAAMPFVVYGLVSRGFGLPFLPTSIESKELRELDEERLAMFRTPAGAIDALRSDTLLLLIVVALLVYLAFALRGSLRYTPLALAFVVTVGIHCSIADMGQMDRYQTYLLVAGVYAGLLILNEVVRGDARLAVTVLLIAVIPAVAAVKVGLVWETPTATSNTYLQRYQVGLFFEKYYDGRSVATGEIGYVTLFHDGPVTDILGIGDPEILAEFERHGSNLPAESLERIARERDVQAVAAYPSTLVYSTPTSWKFAGRWLLEEKRVTAFDTAVDFLAIDESTLNPLVRHLDEQAPDLPSGIRDVDLEEMLEALRGKETAR